MSHSFSLRKATEEDVTAVTALFRSTVLTVNTGDYNAEQLQVWSSFADDTSRWISRINEQHFMLCCYDREITGFASLAHDGYLDVLFVHKDYQRRGIAGILVEYLEDYAKRNGYQHIYSDVSITARPFFESRGFGVIIQQEKTLKGLVFINYRMQKQLH